MQSTMTPEFVMSFVRTCAEAGLTKEAAAELLQYQSVISQAEASPAFGEGFAKVASEVPGGLRPMYREGYMEKAALAAALRQLGAHSGAAMRALGTVGAEAGKAIGRGALKVVGAQQGKFGVPGGGPNWIRRNPMWATGLGVGGTAAGALGLNAMRDPRHNFDVPYLPSSSYNPEESSRLYNSELDARSQGVADLNKRIDDSAQRVSVLENAVKEHGPQSQMAQAELNKLTKERDDARKAREKYISTLGDRSKQTGSMVHELEQKKRDIEARNTDWLHMPQRAWYRLTGRDPREEYNKKLTEVEGPLSQATNADKLTRDLIRRSLEGYRGVRAEPAYTDAQMHARFFPRY